MAKNANSRTETTTISGQVRLEKIRGRAYELYAARGRGEGQDIDDWLQAESEIDAARTAPQKHS